MIPLLPMPVTTTRPWQLKEEFDRAKKIRSHRTGKPVRQRAQRFGLDAHNVFADVLHGRKNGSRGVRHRVVMIVSSKGSHQVRALPATLDAVSGLSARNTLPQQPHPRSRKHSASLGTTGRPIVDGSP